MAMDIEFRMFHFGFMPVRDEDPNQTILLECGCRIQFEGRPVVVLSGHGHHLAPEFATEYRIPDEKWETFQKKIAALAKKAATYGNEPVTWTKTREELKGRYVELPSGKMLKVGDYLFYHVRVSGGEPKIPGWSLSAVIEHLAAGNIVSCVPGQSIPDEYRTTLATRCDHCNAKLKRNETVVIRHDDGHYVQIGKNCVAAYLGSGDPRVCLFYLEFMRSLVACSGEDEEDGGDHGPRPAAVYTPSEIIYFTFGLIGVDGWVSRKMADEKGILPTSSQLHTFLNTTNRSKLDREELEYIQAVEEKAAQHAADVPRVLAWAATLEGKSEYEHNLKLLCAEVAIRPKNVALVASSVAGWRRSQDLSARGTERREHTPSTHFGKVKERVNLDVEVIMVRPCSSDWGTSFLYVMLNAAGQRFKYFSSRELGCDTTFPGNQVRGWRATEAGDKIQLRATIKAHGEYKGEKETVLTRGELL